MAVVDFGDRTKYLGGSDSNVILRTSKFKTPVDLIYEKTGYHESTFSGNIYTLLGDILEPRIREYAGYDDVDDITYEKVINGIPFKCHVDGLKNDTICEIKVSSAKSIGKCLDEYQWQIRTYMAILDLEQCELVLLKREGILKEITNECIEAFIPKTFNGNLNYLHKFEDFAEPDKVKKECEKFLRTKLENVDITPFIERTMVKRDKKIEKLMLKRLQYFWELKEELDNDPFGYQDKDFEYKVTTLKNLELSDFKVLELLKKEY